MIGKATSVKSQIVERLLAILQPLQDGGTVRKIVREHALFALEAVRPALHVVTGEERVIEQDSHGYRVEFPLALQIIFAEQRDPYTAGDEFEAAVQAVIEADEQLEGLASKITYNGAAPFVSEEAKPNAYVVVEYLVEYRRAKAAPKVNY